ncbi:unnamed protein product [Camellia sinensis]
MNPSTPTPPPPPPVSAPPSAQLQMQSSQNPSQNANNDEKIANRAMSNFRALVMKFVTSDTTIPLTPSRKTLMQNRLTHLFPDTHTPDHPTYASMIHGAIKELNEEGGSSEESISKFIKNKHDDLPWAHSTFLKHHLWKLCESGDIAVTYEKRYLLGGAITKLSTNQRTCATPKREQLKTKQRKVRGKRWGRQHKKYVSEEEEETEEETKEETEEEMEEEEEDETEEDEEEEKKMEMEMVDIEIQSGDDASPKREQLKTKQKVRGRPRKKDVIGEEEMEMIDIEILSSDDASPRREHLKTERRKAWGMGRGRGWGQGRGRGRGRGWGRGRPRKKDVIKEMEMIDLEIQVTEEQNKAIEEQNQLTEERDEVFDNQPKDEVIVEQNQVEEKQEVNKEQNQAKLQKEAMESEPQEHKNGGGDEWNQQQKQETCIGEEQKQPKEQNDSTEGQTMSAEQQIEVIEKQNQSLEQQNRVSAGQEIKVAEEQKQQVEKQNEVIEEQHQVDGHYSELKGETLLFYSKPQHGQLLIQLQLPGSEPATEITIAESLPLEHGHEDQQEPGCSDIGRPAETPLDIAFETIGESSMADQQHKNEWKQPQRRGRGRPPMCKSSAGRNVENSQKQLQQKRRGRGRPRKLDSGIQGQ